MDTAQIIAELRAERNRLDQAIAALEAIAGGGAAGGSSVTRLSVSKASRGGRRISAAGRKRIAEAAKRRWAKIKAAKAAPRRLSAAARKRLSELAKARWAKRKREGKTKL